MSVYNCSDPNSVSNGYYVIDKSYYEHGDQVYFICFSTYSLNGNPTLTCDGLTGNWSGTYPTCTSSTTTTTTAAPEYEGNHRMMYIMKDRVLIMNNKAQLNNISIVCVMYELVVPPPPISYCKIYFCVR